MNPDKIKKTNLRLKARHGVGDFVGKELMIADYESGTHFLEISEKFGVSKYKLEKIIEESSIDYRGYSYTEPFREKVNFHLFERPTAETAYWMGFMYADGSVCVRGDAIRCNLGVSPKDRTHLESFCGFLGFGFHRIRSGAWWDETNQRVKSILRVYFTLPNLTSVDTMRDWGIIPNKTYEPFVEPQITSELLPHFLRGWFDGDGSFSIDNKTNDFRVSTSLEAAHWYGESLKKLGYEGEYKIVPNGNSAINYNVRISSNLRIYLVGKLLEPDSTPRLDRKWVKYREIESRIDDRKYKTPKDLLDHPLSLSPKRSKEGTYKYELKL